MRVGTGTATRGEGVDHKASARVQHVEKVNLRQVNSLREAMEEKYIELGWCNGKDVISSNFCVQWLRVRIPGCAIIRREPVS
jgi:hypothetical protein